MVEFVWFQNVVIPILGMGLGGFAIFAVFRTINRALDRRHERLLKSLLRSYVMLATTGYNPTGLDRRRLRDRRRRTDRPALALVSERPPG